MVAEAAKDNANTAVHEEFKAIIGRLDQGVQLFNDDEASGMILMHLILATVNKAIAVSGQSVQKNELARRIADNLIDDLIKGS